MVIDCTCSLAVGRGSDRSSAEVMRGFPASSTRFLAFAVTLPSRTLSTICNDNPTTDRRSMRGLMRDERVNLQPPNDNHTRNDSTIVTRAAVCGKLAGTT